MNHFSSPSFREKSAWVTLGVLLIVYVPYFAYIWVLVRRGQFDIGQAIGVFSAALLFQIMLAIIGQIVISIRAKIDPRDERDAAIESKGFRNAYFVLTFGICLAALFVTMVGLGQSAAALAASNARVAPEFLHAVHAMLSPGAATQLLLLCLVIAEVIRYGTQVFCYRRGS